MPQPDNRTPVIVLGAGIVGICTALSLLEKGVPVTLIDKGEPGQETSMGNAGVVSPWSIIPQSLPGTWKSIPKLMFGYGRPLSIHPRSLLKMIPWGLSFLRGGREENVRARAEAMSHLCGPSIELYQRHLVGTGHEGLITDSMYVHAFRDGSRANLQSIDYRIRSEMGADLELVGKDRLAEIEPELGPDFGAAVLIKGQARMRSPGRLGQVLAEKALEMGAAYKRTMAKRIHRTDKSHWEVECDDGILQAERIILCLGAWSPGLLADLGMSVPLMAERGYHVEFCDPGIEINNSVMDVDAKFVASSMENGVRVAGQAEFAPVDAPPTKRRKQQLIDVAVSAFPNLRTDETTFWMGRRPSFPDSLPVLGPVTDQPGLFVNFGHSHYGLMMAPRSGDILARTMCNEPQNIRLDAYALDRF
ncbi:FAD-binding oxidoreductase [uncultured Tateyamaria sp.]|uniref:NAD(P)/FAD-dependent oxidoreductase n=1 Tax=uncultured Tateyamaria sp. TaxID=455651 RepID=UPI00260A82B8|nr:FAD-binding oxidoreductase [uncultured Tateyamaria sp.]